MFPKWGLAEIETAFRGFMASQRDAVATATGTQISGQEPWLLALGLGPSATVHDANATYRARAKQVASNPEALLRLNAAIETARKFLPE